MKKLVIIVFILLLTACTPKGEPAPQKEIEQNKPQNTQKEEEKTEIALADFFLKDGSQAEFKGEGNEYARYTSKTQWLYGRYVNVYEDNGGTVMLRTFRIDEDKIVVIQEEGESYEVVTPTEKELNEMGPLYTYLELPLNKGASFDGWTVIDDSAKVETPLKVFEDVIVIEKEGEGQSIIRKYFAKGYGEIKREFLMKEGDQEYSVTSTIENVN